MLQRHLSKVGFRAVSLIALLSILLGVSSVSLAQAEAKPFMRLATYWDAPGRVEAVSADDHWIIIYDVNSNTSRLVEVATGNVLKTAFSERGIQFSARGSYAAIYNRDVGQYQLVDLATHQMMAPALADSVRFSPDARFVMAEKRDAATKAYTTRVIEIQTGTTKLTSDGPSGVFSPDSRWIAVTDTQKMVARVIEIESGTVVFEFPLQNYVQGQEWNFTFRFSPDSRLLAISQAHDYTTYVIDTATWQVLYHVGGFVIFSADSRFLTARQDDGPAAGELLLEARSGQQLDKVYGNMWFSNDGKLLYRMDSTNCEYRGAVRVMNLATMKALIDVPGCVNVEMVADNTVAHVTRGNIDEPQIQQLVEVGTGGLIWQAQVPDMGVIDYPKRLALMTRQGRQTIEDFETGDVFATDGVFTLSNSHNLAFASNGLFVDVYGAADAHEDTMPAPRVGSGIFQMAAGKVNVYPKPEMATPVIEENNNPFYFYVMGKSADEHWLYGTYTVYDNAIVQKTGWIANDNQLSVIDDWHDVPVLSGDNPLGELRAISEKQ